MNMKHVIAYVGAIGVTSVAGIILLAALSVGVPDILPIIATSSLTGLAGLLARPEETAEDTEPISTPNIPPQATGDDYDPWNR